MFVYENRKHKNHLSPLIAYLLFIAILLLPANLFATDECLPNSDHSYTMSITNTSDTHTVSMSKDESISYHIQTLSSGTLTVATSNSNNKISLNGSETICPAASNSGITTLSYTEASSFDVNIVVFANNTDSHTLTINFFPDDTPPAFIGTIANINGTLGSGFNFNTSDYFAATNNDTITYSDTNGSILPSGLTLNSVTGVISGTPTTIGTYSNIIVSATDKDGTTNSNSFTITVAAPIALDFTCANPKTFTSVYNGDNYSKLVLIGNSSLCKNDDGSCVSPGNTSNNEINMMNNDYDDSQLDISVSATTTINSSAALLDIPAGKTILWAGLFWQGYIVDGNTTQKEAGRTIKYKHENAINGYQSESNAEMNWVYFDQHRMYYQSFVEITDYVNTNGAGYYWVGDIATTEGKPAGGSFGAWSLAVVYEDENEDFKNITLFHGYQAFAGTDDINNAITYATNNSCPTTNTGVGTGVSSTLSGFLTPQANTVNSSLIVFAGEGDIGLTGDSGSITDSSGTAHQLSNALNPATNIMNATISKDGSTVTTGKPYYSPNSLGIDIDTYDVSNIIENSQSSTDIQFTSSGDGYMPGMYGLSTQLYVPKFCYDYSYKQNDRYFTEDNNGSYVPYVSGTVIPGSPVEVGLYIRNEENSDVQAINTKFSILDINTSQATYIADTTKVTYPNSISKIAVSDNILTNNSQIIDVDIGTIKGQEYFYTYYEINPSVADLELPIYGKLDYTFVFSNGAKNYSSELNNKIPLCSSGNFQYNPIFRTFNVEHPDLFASQKYNLRTQVTSRPENFTVVAYDVNATVNNIHTRKDVNTSVSIELIDAGAFHDTTASCLEPSSSISDRYWIKFNNSDHTNFTEADIISNVIGTPNPNAAKEFYSVARENVAFRISYNLGGDDNGLLDVQEVTGGGWTIANFAGLKYIDDEGNLMNKCKAPVITPSKTYTRIPEACGNAALTNGMTQEELNICLECVYGYNTQYVCSRDNFSIRPESFNIKIKDLNQTDKTQKVSFATDRTGVASPNTAKVNIAAGYAYEFDINATNHTGNDASPGYTRFFTTSSTDHNISFNWDSNLTTLTCNDVTNKQLTFNVINGAVTSEANITNIGDYNLHMIDKGWTSVDWDTTKMAHHTGTNASYFLSGSDCTQNSSIVQDLNVTNPNGCDISTNNHDNSDANLKYRDYNITAHPYKFNLVGLNISQGADFNNTLDSFIYTSNVDDNNSRDMALHIRGVFAAQGYYDETLSNFVTNCYAKDVNLTLDRLMETIVEPYVARFTDKNSTTNVIYDDTMEVNASNNLFSVLDSNFTKDMNGAINMDLDLNFEKNITIPREPVIITLNNFDINCTNNNDCEFQADLISDKHTDGTRALSDANLTHYYGRVHAPDYEFEGDTGTATILYEVYCQSCNQALYNISGEESPDSVYWYLNDLHVTTGDGQVLQFATQENVTFNGSNTTSTAIISAGSESQILIAPDVPYVDRVNMSTDPWLLYNRFDNSALTNDFNVKFLSTSSGWAGEGELGKTIDLNVSTIQNRRLDW